MKPTIINEKSQFVIITYYWGGKNLNKNTQRPCPEDVIPGEKLKKQPVTFDKMIVNLEKNCKKHNCNYLFVEYPEFAVPGGYQTAINYKPKFIYEALEACYPRAVVYIDGDMKVNKYPHIFDIEDVDFMSRGWNVDGRATYDQEANTCFYPYVYELSGGILYFASTKQAKELLLDWDSKMQKMPGKAEDRVLSYIINTEKKLLALNTIQVPIEYLWLDLHYDDFNEKKGLVISHPECLTGEERAIEQSTAMLKKIKSRIPSRYDYLIQNRVDCDILSDVPFYEYIFFPSKIYIKEMKLYLDFLFENHIIDIIPYDKKYGSYNPIANNNIKLAKKITVNTNVQLANILYDKDSIPLILAYLHAGIDVVVYPTEKARKSLMIKYLDDFQFICKNTNKSLDYYKKEYKLKLDKKSPILLSHKSVVLKHMLTMCKTLDNISDIFNSTFIFLTRIRCKFY
jgi:hypothetical protein